ncbi:Vms1/Ankzf1 family peptidyl-tRNA hydrolase [Pseudonocardia halophobica]|uniref:baeRF2 domain-containing protein n=1 Tax=Pseudonocardia halophobica TaxID=29401 RepID=UPI003D91AA96
MRLDWLRDACAAPGPFATVMLDVSHDTEDAARQDELRRRAVREELSGQGAPESVVEAVDGALADAPPPDGTGGRVLVAAEKGVLVDAVLPAPPRTAVTTWSPLPELGAVTGEVREEVPAVVVRVDDKGGEILAPGDAEPEQVSGPSGPVHKVRGGGLSHLNMHERVEETWRENAAAVAERVDARVRASGARVLVVAGPPRARSLLVDSLSERSAQIVAQIDHSGGISPEDVPDTVAAAVEDVLDGERRAAWDHYRQLAGRPDGQAVTGLADVVAAVRAEAVDTLFLDPAALTDAEVWAGTEPTHLGVQREELEALNATDPHRVPGVPAVIRALACQSGQLVRLDDPAVVRGKDRLDDARQAEEEARAAADATGEEAPEPGLFAHGELADGLGATLRFPI